MWFRSHILALTPEKPPSPKGFEVYVCPVPIIHIVVGGSCEEIIYFEKKGSHRAFLNKMMINFFCNSFICVASDRTYNTNSDN